ncbi:hypothetical protein EVAR_22508_1 [Eumeta japonica]|uniref:Uncharacterized protein n=1 Tax=Eumeta variegata TaxID=151549 RepID=A0A4C1ZFR8_EUMVA|nr:hypothetical protein EVAR_75723_1 [Eumeta japonica]GBP85457.1 hypothetical protein EVAR_22508_1 [Eumeta japonica]
MAFATSEELLARFWLFRKRQDVRSIGHRHEPSELSFTGPNGTVEGATSSLHSVRIWYFMGPVSPFSRCSQVDQFYHIGKKLKRLTRLEIDT